MLLADGDLAGAQDELGANVLFARGGRLDQLRAVVEAEELRAGGTAGGLSRCIEQLRALPAIGNREADLYRTQVLVKAILQKGDAEYAQELCGELEKAADVEARLYAVWLVVWFEGSGRRIPTPPTASRLPCPARSRLLRKGTCGWRRCSRAPRAPRSSSSGWRRGWGGSRRRVRERGAQGTLRARVQARAPSRAGLRAWDWGSNPSGRMLPAAERDDDTIAPPPPDPGLHYARIVLKLSGEALCGRDGGFGIDGDVIRETAKELAEVHALGVQAGIVVGGGNIFRGLKGASSGMDRAQGDFMGMLATVINALAMQDALEKVGVPTRVMTAIEIRQVAEPYIRRRAIRHLEKGRVVIFAAGTGNPYFSTDTAAALRAMEIHANCLCKATKVEGIYERDPVHHPEATMYRRMTFDRFLAERIGVMDSTAVTLCRDNAMPIRVFKMATRGNIKRVVLGESIGTIVEGLIDAAAGRTRSRRRR